MVSQQGIKANLEKVKGILDMTSPRTVKEVAKADKTNHSIKQVCL